MQKKVDRISSDMNAEQLELDLESYREKAIELGASRAVIAKVEEIPVDERVVLKCRIPRCFGYGVSVHCPPHALKPGELKEILKKYEWAVFFMKDVPSEVIIRNKATIQERIDAYQQVFKIVSEIESMAFYDGHYLAFGLGAGSCRHTFCSLQKNCAALAGEKCRFSLVARPSMEAVGIDVYKLVASLGWDIYPIGSNAQANDMPKGTLAGIVIVQ